MCVCVGGALGLGVLVPLDIPCIPLLLPDWMTGLTGLIVAFALYETLQ